jgi:hypothetical protein
MTLNYTTSARRTSRALRAAPILLLALSAGCGGEDPQPPAQDTARLVIFGAQARTLSLSTEKMQVTCKPKPGLGEFSYEAATVSGATTGDFLRFTIKDYTTAKTYDMEYGTSKTQHTIEVGLENKKKSASGKDYKYSFFQSLRTDSNEVLNSQCSITLEEKEETTQTIYTGLLNCILLWADYNSPDYDSGTLNNFVDVVGRFECVYGT